MTTDTDMDGPWPLPAYTWPAKACPCGQQQHGECLRLGCKWERDPSLVPASLRRTPGRIELLGPEPDEARPAAWLCELAQEDGSVKTQIVQEDPDGLRWNDSGEPSPFSAETLHTATNVRAYARRYADQRVAEVAGPLVEVLKAIVQELADEDFTSAQQIARHAGRAALAAYKERTNVL